MRKQAVIRQADILDVLQSSDAPMIAYQILERLQFDEPDIAPPTVYRALAALTDQGLTPTPNPTEFMNETYHPSADCRARVSSDGRGNAPARQP